MTTVLHPAVRKKNFSAAAGGGESAESFSMYFRVVDVSLGRTHYEVGLCALQFTFYMKMINLRGKLVCIKFCPT